MDGAPHLQLYAAVYPYLEPGIFFLGAIALLTIVGASVWVEATELDLVDHPDTTPSPIKDTAVTAPFRIMLVGCVFVQAAAFLLLLYFFPSIMGAAFFAYGHALFLWFACGLYGMVNMVISCHVS